MDKKTVMVNGKPFEWTPENGLDIAAALELKGWITKRAMAFMGKARLLHIEADDLIQAGLLAAMNTCKTFNPDYAKFITWANFRISDALTEAVKHPILQSLDEANDMDKPMFEPDDTDAVASLVIRSNQRLIPKLLNTLSKLDKALIKAYYGIGHKREYSLIELTKRFKMSKPTIINKIKMGIVNMRIETMATEQGGIHDRAC